MFEKIKKKTLTWVSYKLPFGDINTGQAPELPLVNLPLPTTDRNRPTRSTLHGSTARGKGGFHHQTLTPLITQHRLGRDGCDNPVLHSTLAGNLIQQVGFSSGLPWLLPSSFLILPPNIHHHKLPQQRTPQPPERRDLSAPSKRDIEPLNQQGQRWFTLSTSSSPRRTAPSGPPWTSGLSNFKSCPNTST